MTSKWVTIPVNESIQSSAAYAVYSEVPSRGKTSNIWNHLNCPPLHDPPPSSSPLPILPTNSTSPNAWEKRWSFSLSSMSTVLDFDGEKGNNCWRCRSISENYQSVFPALLNPGNRLLSISTGCSSWGHPPGKEMFSKVTQNLNDFKVL